MPVGFPCLSAVTLSLIVSAVVRTFPTAKLKPDDRFRMHACHESSHLVRPFQRRERIFHSLYRICLGSPLPWYTEVGKRRFAERCTHDIDGNHVSRFVKIPLR